MTRPAVALLRGVSVIVVAVIVVAVIVVAVIVVTAASASGQTVSRRLTTIDMVRQFPGYYHLQNVLLRGEFSDDDASLAFRSNDTGIRAVLGEGVSTARGPVEVRGHIIDVGRLNQDDPRLDDAARKRERERWPRPGEELFLRVTGVTEAQIAATPSIRSLALEPWKYEGKTITVLGSFRGRNLFGDMPASPARSKYDFVLKGAEGAVWVTGLRPRGKGFELDVDSRVDSNRWLEVTGTLVRDKGLVLLEGTTLVAAKAPDVPAPPAEAAEAQAPKLPVQVVFHSPASGETDVKPTETVRIQFSRGLNEKSLAGRTRVTVAGAPADSPGLAHKAVYDAGSRSVAIRFDAPLPAFSTIRVEILDGVLAFDGAPVTPWTLTFSVGG